MLRTRQHNRKDKLGMIITVLPTLTSQIFYGYLYPKQVFLLVSFPAQILARASFSGFLLLFHVRLALLVGQPQLLRVLLISKIRLT